jgi:hypothetical protein
MPMRYQVVATVVAGASDVESKFRHGEAEVEPIDVSRCTVRLQGDVLEWLAFALIWLGSDFTIHEPVELIDFVGDLSHRLADSIPA